MKTNFEHTFTHFIKVLKVPVTQTSALAYLNNHPHEGSLLAYAETLDRFKIENVGVKIEKERFEELPIPFIAYLHQHGGTFALVKEITHHTVKWLHTQKGWTITPKEDFLKSWQGIALLAESSSESGEKGYQQKRKKEILASFRVPIALILLLPVVIAFSGPAFTTSSIFISLFILKLVGMFAGALLLAKSIDTKNAIAEKLCSNGSKVNCQSILDSPAAKITSWLTWADLGFIYFYGSFISLIACSATDNLNTFLTLQWLFSVGSIFFIAYSLWHQAIKTKIWCTLCLAVVSIFFSEFLALTLLTPFVFSAELAALGYIGGGLAVPVIFLLLLKEPYGKAVERDHLIKKLNKVYTNPAYFKALMENQPFMPPLPENMPTVFFGNPDAENTITMVSNPLCSPCARMHTQLEELVNENTNVKCQVIFLSGENDAGGKFVRKLLSLPRDIQAKAMSMWFKRNDKNFEVWDEVYKKYPEEEYSYHNQKTHNGWVNYAEVSGTPTLFINGKKNSSELNVSDLAVMFPLSRETAL